MAVPAFAAEEAQEQGFSQDFLTNAEYTLTNDEHGNPLITLEAIQPVADEENTFTKTTAVILPEDSDEAIEIINEIQDVKENGGVSLYSGGTLTEDNWYLGSSVYLKSEVLYTKSTSNGNTYVKIDNVQISVSTNSGTTISSLSLFVGQNGAKTNNEYIGTQTRTYNAKTQRSFTPPSTWVPVLWGYISNVGTNLYGYATRPNGQSTYIELVNNVVGEN